MVLVATFGSELGLRDSINSGVTDVWNSSAEVEPRPRELYPQFFTNTVQEPTKEPTNLTLFDASVQRYYGASPCGDSTQPFVAKKVAFSITKSSYELRGDEFKSGDVWAVCYQDPNDSEQWYDSFVRYSVLGRGKHTKSDHVLSAFNHFRFTIRLLE